MSANRRYPAQSYYDLLGVAGTATRGEIRAAYLRLIEEVRAAGLNASGRGDSLNEAYEILMDPAERAAYDTYLTTANSTATADREPGRAAPGREPADPARRATSEGTRPEFRATQTRPPDSRRSGGSILDGRRLQLEQRRRRRRALLVATPFAVAALAGVSVLIVQAVSRQNADTARQAAQSASEESSLEQAARNGPVDCFVVQAGSVTTHDALANQHFPCTGVPVGSGSGETFWAVITVKGVSSDAAAQHGIWLFCSAGSSGIMNGRSDSPPESGVDMRAFVAGIAATVHDPLEQISCEVRTNNGVIRTVQVAITLDPARQSGS